MIDYHLHGNFSGHGSGELVEYVDSALAKGFVEIGFSDHLPKVVDPDPYHAMLEEELPRYVDTVLSLRERYRGRITIRLGIEADYFEGHEDATRELLARFPFDYVLGSIHFLGDWHFTSREGLPRYAEEDPATAFPLYFDLLGRMIATGLFDVVAHPDALRRGSFHPVRSLDREYGVLARLLAARGMAIELNTGGIRRGRGAPYPDRDLLAACVASGVPITLGSDAHSPQDVGRDYGEAFRVLADLGVNEVATFDLRRLAAKPLEPRLDRA